MKKQKLDLTKLSDEELLSYYKKKKNEKKIATIANVAVTFASGAGIIHRPIVFATAAVANIVIGNVILYKKDKNLEKIKEQLEARGLLRKILFEKIKKSKNFKNSDVKSKYVDVFHDGKLLRMEYAKSYKNAANGLEFLLKSKKIKENAQLFAGQGLRMLNDVQEFEQKIKEIDRQLEDLKFLLDETLSKDDLTIPSDVMPFDSFKLSEKKIKEAKELFGTTESQNEVGNSEKQ